MSTELGKVSRNCTEFGWSETFPHYIDACFYEEGNSSHLVSISLSAAVSDSGFQGDILYEKQHAVCSVLCCACVSGHVLCVSEGSVHCGLQHLFGLPHHGHGHPVQVQVRRLVVMDTTAAGWGGVGKHEVYQTDMTTWRRSGGCFLFPDIWVLSLLK